MPGGGGGRGFIWGYPCVLEPNGILSSGQDNSSQSVNGLGGQVDRDCVLVKLLLQQLFPCLYITAIPCEPRNNHCKRSGHPLTLPFPSIPVSIRLPRCQMTKVQDEV